jgi:hypothetical protein
MVHKFQTSAKPERVLIWWNPATQTCPVLDSPLFVPVPTLKQQDPLHLYEEVIDRKRNRGCTLNAQCIVQYTLLVPYLNVGNVLLCVNYQLYFTVCHTNITLYIAFGIIRGSRNFSRSWKVLPWTRGHYFIGGSKSLSVPSVAVY